MVVAEMMTTMDLCSIAMEVDFAAADCAPKRSHVDATER